MTKRTPTPHVPANPIFTGHFDVGADYHTYRPHGTEDWLITLTLRGALRFVHRDGQLITQRGDLVMLRPSTPAEYATEERHWGWEGLWAHFLPSAHWNALLRWPAISPREPSLLHLRVTEARLMRRITDAMRQAHEAATGAIPLRWQFALNHLERALLWCDTINPRSHPAPMDARVQRATEFITHNMTRNLSLDEIAEAAGLSVSRLCELFRAELDTTPRAFLERHRMERARQLLESTSQPIHVIAQQVGYENPFHFTLRFKRAMQVSPRAFRQGIVQRG